MGASQYVVIYQRATAIELQSTDPAVVSPLLEALTQAIKGFGMSACKLPEGEQYYWRLYGLGENVEQVRCIIIEYLCAHGWESVDVVSIAARDWPEPNALLTGSAASSLVESSLARSLDAQHRAVGRVILLNRGHNGRDKPSALESKRRTNGK